MNLSPETVSAICEYAKSRYPEEMVCAIVDGAFVPMANIATDPQKDFAVDPVVFMEILDTGKLEAIVHSHPSMEEVGISLADMRSQASGNIPWGVLGTDGKATTEIYWWGNGAPERDLLGRPFVHGIYDCYSLIRDFFKKGYDIDLPDYPRQIDWWHGGQNMYLDLYTQAGFVPIRSEEVKQGDVFLAQIRSPVPNHGGVVLSGGLILHQLQNRVSMREPLHPWSKYITHYLRYKGHDSYKLEEGLPARLFG